MVVCLTLAWTDVAPRDSAGVARAADPIPAPAATAAPAPPPPPGRVAAAPATDDYSPDALRRQADAMEAQARAFDAVDQAVPRDTFDPAAVVRAAGADPVKLFEWVRDRTAYVPYRGVLRGYYGVLLDRHGNSLDRALLLARLLELGGGQARLVHAALPPGKVEAILKAAWDDPASAGPVAADDDADAALLDRLAAQVGADPTSVRRAVERRDLAVQANQEALLAATTEQSGRLMKLLAPVANAFKPADDRGRQAAAAADHWWVQRRDGDRWVDLDPTLRGNKPGDAPAADPAAVPPAAAGQRPNVADDLWHAVEVRVVAERFDGAAASRSVVLRHVVRTADVPGRVATLGLVALAPPPDLDPDAPDPAGRLRAVLADQKEWVPVLRVGPAQIVQGSVDEAGTVNPNPPLDALAATGATVAKGAQGAFAALNPFGDGGGAAAPGVLAGVWVEFEVRAPGEPPAVVTRALYDAVGPGRRAAGPVTAVPAPDAAGRVARAAALNGRLDFLAAGGGLSEEYVTHLCLANAVGNAPALAKALRTAGTGTTKDGFAAVGKADPLPVALLALAAARRGPTGASPCAVDRPNLIGQWSLLAVDGGAVRPRRATDLIATHTAARGPAAAAFAARLRQGVMETRLEPMALPGGAPGENTTGLFAAAGGAGGAADWVLVRGPDDPALPRLRLGDADALARVRADLANGFAVVAPTAPVAAGGGPPRVGWWRVDPRDGSCVGMMASGMGASMTEYALLTVLSVATGLNTYAGCGGFATGASSGKKLGCAACGAISAALTFLGGAGAIGLAGTAGKAAAGFGGFAGGNVAGNACNAFSAMAN